MKKENKTKRNCGKAATNAGPPAGCYSSRKSLYPAKLPFHILDSQSTGLYTPLVPGFLVHIRLYSGSSAAQSGYVSKVEFVIWTYIDVIKQVRELHYLLSCLL